jgi:hypothetical protein
MNALSAHLPTWSCGASRVAVIACIAGLLTTRLYLGYWLAPPDVSSVVAPLNSVERFSSFTRWFPESSTPLKRRSGPEVQQEYATIDTGSHRDDPLPRVCRALAARGLEPAGADPIHFDEFHAVEDALIAAGLLEARNAWNMDLFGDPVLHLVQGTHVDGRTVYVVAAVGRRYSREHFGYSESMLVESADGTLDVLTSNQFRFDGSVPLGFVPWAVGGLVAALMSVKPLLLALARGFNRIVAAFRARRSTLGSRPV